MAEAVIVAVGVALFFRWFRASAASAKKRQQAMTTTPISACHHLKVYPFFGVGVSNTTGPEAAPAKTVEAAAAGETTVAPGGVIRVVAAAVGVTAEGETGVECGSAV